MRSTSQRFGCPLKPCVLGVHMIGSVSPDRLQPRDELLQSGQQPTGAPAVVHVGASDKDRDRRASCIEQQKAFAPLHILVGVVPTDAGRLLDSLHTLTVHGGDAQIRTVAYAPVFGAMHCSVEQMPDPTEAKATKVVEHRLPGREILGEIAPSAAATHDVEDGVENAAQRVDLRSALGR